jgi:hypothetical protein
VARSAGKTQIPPFAFAGRARIWTRRLDSTFQHLAERTGLHSYPLFASGYFGRAARLAYNAGMARGWESKSVAEQQAAAAQQAESKQRLTPEQAALKQQAEAIGLSRRRIVAQLETIQNPSYRQMLERALTELDARLARLG